MRRFKRGEKIRHHTGQVFIVHAVRSADYDIECIEGSEQEENRGVFEVHADYAHSNFERLTGISVTTTDSETGESETAELRDFVLVCGTHELSSTQRWANGTIQLILKPEGNRD